MKLYILHSQGKGGWDTARHVDTGWVHVTLKDVNDNAPVFLREQLHVTVREDTAPSTLLASMPAKDPDEVSLCLFMLFSQDLSKKR